MEKVEKPKNTGGSWGLTDDVVKLWIKRVCPGSVIDLGCGMGKYQEIVKELFGVRVKIDGVDIFPETVRWLKDTHFYNNVFLGDIRKFNFGKYDLAIAGDVLEHLHLEEIDELLKDFYNKKVFKYIIIVLPLGDKPQGSCGGNKSEEHLATVYENWLIPLLDKIGYNIVNRYITNAQSQNGKYEKMALMCKI